MQGVGRGLSCADKTKASLLKSTQFIFARQTSETEISKCISKQVLAENRTERAVVEQH